MSIKKILAAVMTAGTMMSFIPTTSLADSTGWHKAESTSGIFVGWKYYTLEDGYIYDEWKKIDGILYYFEEDGYMVAGAENYYIDGKYYNFSSSGECLNPGGKAKLNTGWNKISNTGYDYSYDGVPLPNKVSHNWIYIGSDGELYKGWHSINGKWYYFDENNGRMYSCRDGGNPLYIDSYRYYFKPGSGEMLTGWISDSTYWYYARPNGILYINEWLYSGGKWYYFDGNGHMLFNVYNYLIGDAYYSFDSNGVCINPSGTTEFSTGWVKRSNRNDSHTWGYVDEQGKFYTGWKKIDGYWYYFDNSGLAYKSVSTLDGYGFVHYVDGKLYSFNDKGQMLTGWVKLKEYLPNGIASGLYYWQYARSDGSLYCNEWLFQDGKWYYFRNDGRMLANVDNYLIDGKYYSFDLNGACKNSSGVSGKITGWFKVCDGYNDSITRRQNPESCWEYKWFYYDSNGVMYKNKWLNYSGKWYYFDNDGKMVISSNFYIKSEKKVYDFDENGVCMNPDNPRDYKI